MTRMATRLSGDYLDVRKPVKQKKNPWISESLDYLDVRKAVNKQKKQIQKTWISESLRKVSFR